VLPADGQAPLPEAALPTAPVNQKGGRDQRRPPAKKAVVPRPPTAPVVNAPPAPVAGQPQVAPLPPPIDVRPAPGPAAKPKPPPPRPPLALTPQVANPPPRSN
jgi:large subunit ribosomal protein L24